MAEQENVRVDLEGDALLLLRQLSAEMEGLKGQVSQFEQTVNEGVLGKSAKMLGLNAAVDAIQTFASPLREGRDSVYAFDHSMRELSAITGITGSGLEMIGDNAIEASKKFGGDAAANLETYQILLSKLDPALAKNPVALASMGDSVSILAKTMKGDGVGAVNALSSAMNQYGIDLKDPERAANSMRLMMSQMAASAQAGSQDVQQVAAALDASGAVAKNAGVSFIETNAALQVLGKFGKEGAEGGVALRNVLSIMGKEEFLPKRVREELEAAGVDIATLSDHSLTLGERLAELNKIKDNDSLLGGMFGMENVTAITGLLESQDLLEEYKGKIELATNAGEEMAATIGESYDEVAARIEAKMNAVRLSIFSLTGDTLPYLDAIGGGVMSMIELAPGVVAMAEAWKLFSLGSKAASVWTAIQTGAQWALNTAMSANPVFAAIAGLALLTAGIGYAWENFEGFRAGVYGLWEAFKQVFGNISDFFGEMLAPVFEAISLFMDGDFAGAAMAAAKGALNIATMPIQAVAAIANGDLTKGVGDAYAKGDAEGRASFAADQPTTATGETAGTVETPCICIPTGEGNAAIANSNSTGGSSDGGSVKGGKIITVNIQQLVGTIENHYNDARESAEAMRSRVSEALIGAVRDFEMKGA